MRFVLASLTTLALLVFAVPAAHAQTSAAAYQQSYDLEATGKLEPALQALEQLSPADKYTYTYHLRHGWLLYLTGKFGPAVDAYKLAMSKAPGAAEAQLGLLLPLIAARRFSEASSAALSILSTDPRNSTALAKLAWSRYNEGRYSEAADAYKKALADYPANVDLRAGLGWSYLKLGKANEAAAELREVLQIAPRHATAKAGLEQLGQRP